MGDLQIGGPFASRAASPERDRAAKPHASIVLVALHRGAAPGSEKEVGRGGLVAAALGRRCFYGQSAGEPSIVESRLPQFRCAGRLLLGKRRATAPASRRVPPHPPQRVIKTQGSSTGKEGVVAKILLIQGANLTFLGRREPQIYGSTTPAELDGILQRHARDHGYQLEIFYTNIEGEAINRIYRATDEAFDGLVMNPAGFTYAGFALKDCIKGTALPYVEVHISNITKRNIHCVLSDIAEGMITGFGMHSYILGLDAMLEILRKRTG